MADVAQDSSHTVSISAAAQPRYLDFDGALEKLRALGFHLTRSQLRERVRNNVLPFFKEAGKLYISEQVLEMHYIQRQYEAERAAIRDRKKGNLAKRRRAA